MHSLKVVSIKTYFVDLKNLILRPHWIQGHQFRMVSSWLASQEAKMLPLLVHCAACLCGYVGMA